MSLFKKKITIGACNILIVLAAVCVVGGGGCDNESTKDSVGIHAAKLGVISNQLDAGGWSVTNGVPTQNDVCNMVGCEKLAWNRIESTGDSTIERSSLHFSEGYNSLKMDMNGMWWSEIEGSHQLTADIDNSTQEAVFLIDIFSDAVPLQSYVGVIQLYIKAYPNDWYDCVGTIAYNIPSSSPNDFTTHQILVPSYQTGLIKNNNPFKIKLSFSGQSDTAFWVDNLRFCNDSSNCQNDCVYETDWDNLSDRWENEHFGNLNSDEAGDPDSDNLSNLVEYFLGTDPIETTSPMNKGKYYKYDDFGRIAGTVLIK